MLRAKKRHANAFLLKQGSTGQKADSDIARTEETEEAARGVDHLISAHTVWRQRRKRKGEITAGRKLLPRHNDKKKRQYEKRY